MAKTIENKIKTAGKVYIGFFTYLLLQVLVIAEFYIDNTNYGLLIIILALLLCIAGIVFSYKIIKKQYAYLQGLIAIFGIQTIIIIYNLTQKMFNILFILVPVFLILSIYYYIDIENEKPINKKQ